MRGIVLAVTAVATIGLPLLAQGPTGGPKIRIAVMDAEWDPGVVQSAWMPGGGGPDVYLRERQSFARGLTEMMIAELVNTGRFVVVERTQLADVTSEQNLQQSGAVNQETAAKVGQLIGAQFLIRPAITEFSYGDQAGTKGVGVRPPVSAPVVGRVRIGGGKAKIIARLVLDSRIVEVETGAITQSLKSEATAEQSMSNFDLGTAVFDYDNTEFQKTPLGAATREAVADAVKQLVANLGDKPWQGSVVTMRGNQIYINAGQDMGIRVGDVVEMSRAGEALVDPATGLNLGAVETKLGRARVTSVQEKFSIAEPLDSFTCERGDIVRFSGR